MRTYLRIAGIAGLSALALALAGCGKNAQAPAPGASESAGAMGPDAPQGLTVSDAVVRLPAVAGRPGVAYFTVTQTGGEPRAVAGLHVDGVGRVEMHRTVTEKGVSKMLPVKEVPVPEGKPLKFQPGGYHVMLFNVDPSLKPGGKTELTVTFDNGDKASVDAEVETITGGGAMGKMDHK